MAKQLKDNVWIRLPKQVTFQFLTCTGCTCNNALLVTCTRIDSVHHTDYSVATRGHMSPIAISPTGSVSEASYSHYDVICY